jgi:hypothetical protein
MAGSKVTYNSRIPALIKVLKTEIAPIISATGREVQQVIQDTVPVDSGTYQQSWSTMDYRVDKGDQYYRVGTIIYSDDVEAKNKEFVDRSFGDYRFNITGHARRAWESVSNRLRSAGIRKFRELIKGI